MLLLVVFLILALEAGAGNCQCLPSLAVLARSAHDNCQTLALRMFTLHYGNGLYGSQGLW